MARGPYQGTFVPNARPVIGMSPDAVVFINGQQEVTGCPKCSRSFDVNKYVTSIQTNLNVDSSPGSATISLSVPRHSIDDFYFDGNPVITTMMEVEIYCKGYYLMEGVPQYYPIFWGIITEVGDSYSSGEHTVTLTCADILKWWDICRLSINAALTAPTGQQGRNLMGNVFMGMNPFDIIYTLANQSFGDIILGTGSLNAFVRDAEQRSTFDPALSDMMAYWEKRFSRMRSNLVLYGAAGVAVRGNSLEDSYSKATGVGARSHLVSRAVRDANGEGGSFAFNPASPGVVTFKNIPANAGQIPLWQSEYQTKLELANAAKESIGYEFYMDVTGDIVFKPPFYNLDILANKPVSWIQDIDVISWDFSESESEVVTQLQLQGSFNETSDYGIDSVATPMTSVVDYHLLRKYGWRPAPYNAEFQTSPQMAFIQGLDVLDRINAKRFRGNVSIPCRPELRLGFPIYVASKDQVWYVTGISHSISFGGQATTTLTLTGKREKFTAPTGMGDLKLNKFNGVPLNTNKAYRYSSVDLAEKGSFTLDVTNAAEVPGNPSSEQTHNNPLQPMVMRHPRTGRIVGYPNVVLAYTKPFDPISFEAAAGQTPVSAVRAPNPHIGSTSQEAAKQNLIRHNEHVKEMYTSNLQDHLLDKYLNNSYQYGLNSAGSFVYAHDSSTKEGVINEVLLLPAKNLTTTPKDRATIFENNTALIRPVSDERGFELIGHFQYGRRVFLKDGRLISKAGDDKVRIDVQLAISGDLSATLNAQSQGLTSVITSFQDPAATLATMQPDDWQTAGALGTPGQDKPDFVDIGDNFASRVAVLDSKEQKGVPTPTVEASQFSRSLTLAEMGVRELSDTIEEDCVCLSGRSDLAFMSTDYQTAALNPFSSSPVVESSLRSLGVSGESRPISNNSDARVKALATVNNLTYQLQQLQKVIDDAAAQVEAAQDEKVAGTWRQTAMEAQAKMNDLNKQEIAAEEALEAIEAQLHGSNSILFQPTASVISRVDQFLVNLYSKLDEAHQEFEKAIRGDLLPISKAEESGLNGGQLSPESEFAPPFSAPNRYQLGDPKAAIGAIQSNAGEISKAWSTFGKNLSKNSKTTALSGTISRDQNSITRLKDTKSQLEAQRDAKAKVVPGDLDGQISALDKRIAELEQQVAANQAKLSEVTNG